MNFLKKHSSLLIALLCSLAALFAIGHGHSHAFLALTCLGALLTAPFDAPERAGNWVTLPVEAGQTLYSGGIIARNAAGNAVPANDAAGLRVVGRCDEPGAWNQNGVAGEVTIRVRRGIFAYNNSIADPVAQADIGNIVFIENDSTINKTGGINKVVAGRLTDIDSQTGMIWVDFNDKSVTVA